ncbi:hypothetical protein CYMTET_51337 [Cymbomonas tetramitiformis]|uniref:Retrovirus-related Pol polyprotein from transposon TNT 1-94-like beta-barrel domain-containing protein n=1 Tax=Cymbomonas tetramitiformis TaxID=36881 RepID=A0AAE0BLE6_9CHLO|nr:hypothetical protein CYMTET_51337 [Cymbomonas tetramitiformis]
MCVDTLEAIVVSMILISLHSDYVYVKTKFQTDRLPRLHVLEDEVCAHYDNIIAPSAASHNTGAGMAEDRKQQNATKKARLSRKVECPTCHRRGHDAKDCFITNKEAREAFLKRQPDAKDSLMQKVQEYEKQGKLPETDKAAAVADSKLHPGLDGEDVLFAISEVKVSLLPEPMLPDFSGVALHEFMEVRGGAARVRATRRQSILEVPTSNYYEVLGTPVATGDCTLHSDCTPGSSPIADCFHRWRKAASKTRLASIRKAGKRQCCERDLHRHRQFPVVPVYDSFVYVDTICSFFPHPERLAATQFVWEAHRDRCLGGQWRISPRQQWYTPAVQRSHTYVVSHADSVLECAQVLLDEPPCPIGCEVSEEDILTCVCSLRGATDTLQSVIQREPTVVRAALSGLLAWAVQLEHAVRAVRGAMKALWSLVAPPCVNPGSTDGSDSSCDEHTGMPDLLSDSESDCGGSDWETGALPMDYTPVWEAGALVAVPAYDNDWDAGALVAAPAYDTDMLDLLSDSGSDNDDSDWEADILSMDYTPTREAGALVAAPAYDADWDVGSLVAVPAYAEVACGAGDILGHGGSSGKSAVLDSGATRHIFNDMGVFDRDYDPMGGSTFSVVQDRPVSSAGSGTVHFAKTDVVSGRAGGLRLRDAHLIPGQPFNLISVVALEDAGFHVDFQTRQISNGGVVFSFSREGKQYIIREDSTEALDTYMACGAHDPPPRDKTNWKFEDTESHFETHGPFNLELFAAEDNHILPVYCTTSDSCFGKDWAGKACYGNPPFEHGIILQCLQKTLPDYAR